MTKISNNNHRFKDSYHSTANDTENITTDEKLQNISTKWNIDLKLLDLSIEQHFAVAGNVSNEKLNTCNFCKANGWPHEAIEFERVNGRVLSDGSNEVDRWIVRDYFNGNRHVHRLAKTRETSC